MRGRTVHAAASGEPAQEHAKRTHPAELLLHRLSGGSVRLRCHDGLVAHQRVHALPLHAHVGSDSKLHKQGQLSLTGPARMSTVEKRCSSSACLHLREGARRLGVQQEPCDRCCSSLREHTAVLVHCTIPNFSTDHCRRSTLLESERHLPPRSLLSFEAHDGVRSAEDWVSTRASGSS
eukprot:3940273-Rhodomonas_salina.2